MRSFFAKVWGYWGALGHEIGRVMTPVHMFLVYVLVFGPANLFLRVGGKDPLQRKTKREATSWNKKESHPATLENLRHTF
jgi:hypothetical protein